jgi:hypothetical protein
VVYQPTRPTTVAIGERRAPQPEGRPGYLRVDTVHQGDLEGVKGVYHINAVDEVTQWQVVGATAYISEAWLIPVLEAMLTQFPFRIRAFHSDNGSEFINHTVAGLLNKLLIEQTKSRPRHSNDNGLAESKNGAVIRKHMGYGHIAAPHAQAIETFYEEHFNPYLNFHRPCGVAEHVVNAKGKEKRLPLVRHSVGDPTSITGHRRLSEPGNHHGELGATWAHSQRYGGSTEDAASKTGVIRESAPEENCMKTAVEMTGHGRGGKPKAGFPPRPQPLEIANCAIPTFPQPRRRAEKWKTKKHVFHFPAHCLGRRRKEAW